MRHEIQLVKRLFVILHIPIAFSGALMVIKGYARRNHIDDRQPTVGNRRFQNGRKLLLVTAERAGYESGAPSDRERAAIEWRKIVGRPALKRRAQIGGGGKLSLGQAVDAVVFDHINH